MRKIKVVYVACAYTTLDPVERELNIATARQAAYNLAKAGYSVIAPTITTGLFDDIGDHEYWIESGLELLSRCDAMFVCQCTENSAGVHQEINECMNRGIPFVTSIRDLAKISI